jgi:4-amino-4-deoxy-L-arabinose transferase-like glycosyltransferase
VEALGSDSMSAWHLINFLFFQLGVLFLYRISKRWMSKSAALFTALFFSLQPLLWGHAFINPKDPPFMTFFLASVCFGFEMVDTITQNEHKAQKILLASFFLGIATSIRVLGPLAGLLVFIYFMTKETKPKAWRLFVYYGFGAILVMFITWPFLWENPFNNFVNVFLFMSNNPTQLSVLFGGIVYRASDLPRRYLPFMIAATLTEPTLPLFVIGVVAGYWKLIKNRWSNREAFRDRIVSLSLILSWFLIVFAYVLLRKPAMYDGMRHFLFILPPIFIFSGLAFQFIIEQIKFQVNDNLTVWLRTGLGFLLILPGINGIAKLHPYEYSYYNSFVGGTSGAFRSYETDYWLTCYKDSVEGLNDITTQPASLFVKREAYIARLYADANINVLDLRGAANEVGSGDFVLVNTRTNEDRSTFRDDPTVIEIKRGGAIFCIIRQVP